MSINSKNKILITAVVILLLTNIAVLLFFLYNKGPEKRGGHGGGREAMMTEFLQKEIGFNQQQLAQYDTLSKQQHEKMKADFDEMRKNREDLYKQLGSQAFTDSAINMVAARSVDMQKGMEIKMLSSFRDIRKLCTVEQQPKFDSLFYKIWNRRGDNRKKPTQ